MLNNRWPTQNMVIVIFRINITMMENKSMQNYTVVFFFID